MISSIARRRSIVCDSSSSRASVTACPAARSSSSRRRSTVFFCSSAVEPSSGASASRRDSTSAIACRLRCWRRASCASRWRCARSRSSVKPRSRSSSRRSVRASLLDEPLGRRALRALERRPALLREAALLGGEQRRGLGSLPCEHATDLLGVRGRLGWRRPRGRHAGRSSTSSSDAVAGPRVPVGARATGAAATDHGQSETRAEDPGGH